MVYLDKRRAQEAVIEAIAAGAKVEDAMNMVERAVKTYEGWRAEDPDFARKVDEARKARDVARARGLDNRFATMDFETWRKEFLDRDTFAHQKVWIDLLEGRDPTLRPGETLIEGSPNRLIISTPPFHCAEVSTPVFTSNRGWTTIGEVTEDDWLVGPDGIPMPVLETWEPDGPVDLFRVTFGTGDEVVTDAGHLWEIEDSYGKPRLVSTLWLMENPYYSGHMRWRVRMAGPVKLPDAPNLPLDPYLFGYWLGDGDSSGSRFAVSEADLAPLLAELDRAGFSYSLGRDGRGVQQVYVRKMRHLLPLGNKHIPQAYLMASVEQRLALLQGLLDSDGSITAKDGRVKFTQVNRALAEQVYQLIASLGYQPRIREEKQNPVAPNGKASRERITCVYFKPNDEQPVFRLERKARQQKITGAGCRTNYRTIRSIAPAGRGRVRCISAATSGNMFLIGNGMIPTRNAKSSTVTIDYSTYRICMNPNVRIILVSKKAEQAKKFLYAIKMRLTSSRFAKLQAAYAPSGGFKAGRGDAWTANMIYVAGRDSAEKDPTVEALGIGGQIYGARADLIILDDVVTLTNAGEWSKQMEWINQEVASRLYGGKLLVVGTRVAPQDLYSELLNGENYLSGRSPWTHLRQPAVLAFSDDPKDWKTLWPASTEPLDEEQKPLQDGIYEAWSGPKLFEIRSNLPPKTWSLVYMQQQVAENMTFDPTCVWGSVNRRRKPGPLVAGALDHPPRGLEGQWVIASMDPAMSGDTFTVVGAVDRQTSKRHIMNAWVKTNPHPTYIRDLIKEVTETYRVNEWVIEQNAFQLFLVHDPEIRQFLASRGVTLTPHFTGRNKQDPDFGVASVAPLFGTTRSSEESGGRRIHNKDNLITLPDPDLSEGIKVLLEELFVWEPGRLGRDLRQDGPMALWFFELRARAVLGHGKAGVQSSFLHNPYLTKADRSRRVVVPMHEYRAG